jgi:hypothetical protein
VATAAPRLRSARGADRALLDLQPLAGGRIGVADVAVDGWDAALLAEALNQSEWARQTRTCAEAIPVELFRADTESHYPSHDLASLHDDAARAESFARAVAAAATEVDAWLFGPWLGTDAETSRRLREQLSVPGGEITSQPGGAAGSRFERARDRLLESAGVRVVRARATRLRFHGGAWSVGGWTSAGESAGEGSELLAADAVVLAVGGLVSGGVGLRSRRSPEPGSGPFALSLDAPVHFELDGEELLGVASLHGLDLQSWGIGALERVGIATDAARVRGAEQLFAAGSVVAGRPRTTLEAVRTGIAAARAALG